MGKREYGKRKLTSSYTNMLGALIILMLFVGLIMSFFLATYSIRSAYTGPLYCWTAIFAPIGTAASIVLSKIVDKKKAENTCNGKGITFAAAEAKGFQKEDAPMI